MIIPAFKILLYHSSVLFSRNTSRTNTIGNENPRGTRWQEGIKSLMPHLCREAILIRTFIKSYFWRHYRFAFQRRNGFQRIWPRPIGPLAFPQSRKVLFVMIGSCEAFWFTRHKTSSSFIGDPCCPPTFHSSIISDQLILTSSCSPRWAARLRTISAPSFVHSLSYTLASMQVLFCLIKLSTDGAVKELPLSAHSYRQLVWSLPRSFMQYPLHQNSRSGEIFPDVFWLSID